MSKIALTEIGRFVSNKPTTRKFQANKRKQSVSRLYAPAPSEVTTDVATLYADIKDIVDGKIPDGLSDAAIAQLKADAALITLHITKRDGGEPVEFMLLKDVA